MTTYVKFSDLGLRDSNNYDHETKQWKPRPVFTSFTLPKITPKKTKDNKKIEEELKFDNRKRLNHFYVDSYNDFLDRKDFTYTTPTSPSELKKGNVSVDDFLKAVKKNIYKPP